ncbi:hypothetical protein K8S19_06295 [bacterium]|nr:hypothetical protein [bacterium]
MIIKRLIIEEDAQAMTEYILVTAAIVLALTGVLAAWKLPIAKYLNKMAQVLVKTR